MSFGPDEQINKGHRFSRRSLMSVSAVGFVSIGGCIFDTSSTFDSENEVRSYYEAIAKGESKNLDNIIHSDSELHSWFREKQSVNNDEWKLIIQKPRTTEGVNFEKLQIRNIEISDTRDLGDSREVDVVIAWENRENSQSTKLSETLEFRQEGGNWYLWDANPQKLIAVHDEIGPFECPSGTGSAIDYVSRRIEFAEKKTSRLIHDHVYTVFRQVENSLTPRNLSDATIRFPILLVRGKYYEYINTVDEKIKLTKRNREFIEESRTAAKCNDIPKEDFVIEVIDNMEERTDTFIEAAKKYRSAADIYAGNNAEPLGDFQTRDSLPGPRDAKQDLIDGARLVIEARRIKRVPDNLEDQLQAADR